MLTPAQLGYLETVPIDKIARVVAFDPASQITAQEIITEIKTDCPTAKVFYIGSSKLGIAGENDIDLTIIAGNSFDNCGQAFVKRFGKPKHQNRKNHSTTWEFTRNTFPVELHLSNSIDAGFQEQLDTQEILEHDKELCLQYEQLKLRYDGLPWKEYLIKKYR